MGSYFGYFVGYLALSAASGLAPPGTQVIEGVKFVDGIHPEEKKEAA